MKFPRDGWIDSTLPLLRDPYRYIYLTAHALGTPGFRTRLLGRATLCLTGHDAAQLFYTPGAFDRHQAAPARIRRVIFGPAGVVQGLDGAAHRARKAQFLALMNTRGLDDFIAILDRETTDFARYNANNTAPVDLYLHLRRMLTRSAFAWAGIPLSDAQLSEIVPPLSALFEKAASIGPSHWRGLLARRKMQRRMIVVIRQIRRDAVGSGAGTGAGGNVGGATFSDPRGIAADSPAAAVALWRDERGRPLPASIAAAELLNLLRPIVAVSVFGVQLAHALYHHPQAAGMAATPGASRRAFVQEVRRHYPFFPLIVGIANHDMTLEGRRIAKGCRVALDLWGTSRDAAVWDKPHIFAPRRFLDRKLDAFGMIPQGGGDHAINHRCPGEWLTIRILEHLAAFLTQQISYDVTNPGRDMDMRALPALPKGGFFIGNIRPRETL
ncbi:cytochrome P450 [Brevirhabdus sp.]|uniref:cytochrome P450 n=1 Tax=Brevirhabdus sp. TaxID=2004514 RepID=UPI0040598B2E